MEVILTLMIILFHRLLKSSMSESIETPTCGINQQDGNEGTGNSGPNLSQEQGAAPVSVALTPMYSKV